MSLQRLSPFSSRILSSIRRLSAVSTQIHPRYNFHAMASQSVPKTMKGVIIEKNGGTEVLQYKTDLPVPEPQEGQVLVKNDYSGINYIDT